MILTVYVKFKGNAAMPLYVVGDFVEFKQDPDYGWAIHITNCCEYGVNMATYRDHYIFKHEVVAVCKLEE